MARQPWSDQEPARYGRAPSVRVPDHRAERGREADPPEGNTRPPSPGRLGNVAHGTGSRRPEAAAVMAGRPARHCRAGTCEGGYRECVTGILGLATCSHAGSGAVRICPPGA